MLENQRWWNNCQNHTRSKWALSDLLWKGLSFRWKVPYCICIKCICIVQSGGRSSMWKKLAWDPLFWQQHAWAHLEFSTQLVVQYQEEKVAEFTEAAAKESQIMSSFAVKSFRLFRRLQQRVSDCFGVWSSSQFLLFSALAVWQHAAAWSFISANIEVSFWCISKLMWLMGANEFEWS
jgi:hypothetical protein